MNAKLATILTESQQQRLKEMGHLKNHTPPGGLGSVRLRRHSSFLGQ